MWFRNRQRFADPDPQSRSWSLHVLKHRLRKTPYRELIFASTPRLHSTWPTAPPIAASPTKRNPWPLLFRTSGLGVSSRPHTDASSKNSRPISVNTLLFRCGRGRENAFLVLSSVEFRCFVTGIILLGGKTVLSPSQNAIHLCKPLLVLHPVDRGEFQASFRL